MPSGDAIWNPLSGERALVLTGAEETGGEYVEAEFAVAPGGFLPGGPHSHPEQVESFEVLDGALGIRVEGEETVLSAGGAATVEPGQVHEWWVAGEQGVRARVRVAPALEFEAMIMAVWGLCADGLTDARGNPDPLRGALLVGRFAREYRPAKPPMPVQRLLFPPLRAIARRRGYERMFDRYGDPARHPSAAPGLGYLPDTAAAPSTSAA